MTEWPLVEVFREEAGHITSTLIRRFGDFDLAEESAQDALVAALETWPESGVPERPAAWVRDAAGRRAVGQRRSDPPSDRAWGPAGVGCGLERALFTHRVRMRSASDVDGELLGWLRAAYDAGA